MSQLDIFLDRNKRIAAEDAATAKLQPWLPDALPLVKAIIIGCADMRVDPAHILGLEPGEAVVMRNIGGRVTPGLLAQLGMLGRIGQAAQRMPGGGGPFHLIVLHHTDCGITRLANDTAMLADFFGVATSELPAKAVRDPYAAVRADVAFLRSVQALPSDWLLSGLVYDVPTGLVHIAEPARLIAD